MKKCFYFFISFLFSSTVFATQNLGIITDEDFLQVGVKPENIKKAKEMVNTATKNYKILILEKQQLELEVNKCILEGAENNLDKIDALFDKMGEIQSHILKNKMRNQIQIQKYITQEQYLKARTRAINRINQIP